MKIALCFLISYDHNLSKEDLWIDWIKPNKDIINIYFHYKSFSKIKSQWIQKHAIPEKFLKETDYKHVVPAYLSLINYGLNMDKENQWFCFLTDSCVPIISPLSFRKLFFENYNYSIMKWSPIYWNIYYTKRANLHLLKEESHLHNTPWFVLKREDAIKCIKYSVINKYIYNLICDGDIANESIFAIMLKAQNSLEMVKNKETSCVDWSRMTSPTSPYVFNDCSLVNIKYIDDFLKNNKYTMFLRKIGPSFNDDVLKKYHETDLHDYKKKWNLKLIEFELKIYKYSYLFKYYLLFGSFIFLYYFYRY